MRNFPIYAAVLAATFSAAPAFADSYRSGDAAPVVGQVSSNGPRLSAYGFGATEFGVSPRNNRDGDAAPVSTVMTPGSVSGAGTFGISNADAASGNNGYFTSPRFE